MRKLLAGLAVGGLLAIASPASATGQTPEGTLSVSTTTAVVGADVVATASDLYVPHLKKGSYAYIWVECPSQAPMYLIVPPPSGSFTFSSQVAETCEVYLRARTTDGSGTWLTNWELGDIDVTFTSA